MPRVHPKANGVECGGAVRSDRIDDDWKEAVAAEEKDVEEEEEEVVLTVWRKSLLLNGKGFTVFDAKGDLMFRVDNYASDNKGEIVLMDSSGTPLLTIRKKKLSLGDHWLIYDREETSNPLFSVKKHINLLHPKSLAHIVPCTGGGSACASPSSSPAATPFSSSSSGGGAFSPKASFSASAAYEVEGSYSQRCCVVYDGQRRKMAEIKRKESSNVGIAYGLDVFRLIVQPGFDTATAMAIVILLEQMFGSKGSFVKG